MHPNVVISSVTSALAVVFTLVMVQRWLTRRQPYYAVWALGLLWYALSTGAEAVGGLTGWTEPLYKLWYVTGAIGVAAYLGAGTLYLHRDPPFGSLAVLCVLGASVPALATDHLAIGFLGLGSAIGLGAILTFRPRLFAESTTVLLLVASAVAAMLIIQASVEFALLPTGPQQIVSGQAFDSNTRALTPPFNIAGALVLILGAVLSALQAMRERTLTSRLLANILIATGAFIPSVASGITRFGITSIFFLGELLGLAFIFAGFLLSGSRGFSRFRPVV